MKHQKYLSTKPPTYAALERRIDELSKPGHALRELAVQLNAEADKTREAFKRTPTCPNARAWFNAYVAKKEFAEGQFIQGAHGEESHAQSALRRDPDSFAIYLPILAKVADLLGEDIEDARTKIRKSLAEIEAEVDPDSVKPLPALRAKLEHVQTLIEHSAIPARRTDSLVDQINAVINGNLPEPAAPRAPFVMQGAPAGAREVVTV